MNNNFHITIPVSGLIKREDYKFDIVGVGGNWPAVANPPSGTFTAKTKSINISTDITFLPTTGYASGSLKYNLSYCGYDNTSLFTNVAAKITSLSDNSIIQSDPIYIACNDCLPNISINLSGCGSTSCSQYVLTSGNTFDFISTLSGLEPNTTYDYKITSSGSNWPTVMITPPEGSFIPTDSTYDMKHKLMFCPYCGVCENSNNGLLAYELAECFNVQNLFTNIAFSISPARCNKEKTFSKHMLVNCKDCLPRISLSLPDKISLSSGNKVTITGIASGLTPNTRYTYIYNSLDSNWPSIMKPVSGSFVATSSKENITTDLMFCYPSGNCPSGTANLLPYTLDTQAEKDFNNKKLHNNLKLNLSSTCGLNINTKECVVECDDCLPCIKYANAIFSGSPVIMLPSGCCQGQKLVKVNITNAIPGDKYTYRFTKTTVSGVVNDISFSPPSGDVYFGGGGNGQVLTVVTANLSNFVQSLLNFELTHVNTNNKTYDSVGLVCISGFCGQ